MTTKAPKFTTANLHALQVLLGGLWVDYASIKTAADMKSAIEKVDGGGRYRIVKCLMGTHVVYA